MKVRLDAEGKPILLERIENDESHQLVEEFMLAANEAVARELKNRSVPTIYRVHENPDPEKLAEYRELILSYGYKAGDVTNRGELQRILASQCTPEDSPQMGSSKPDARDTAAARSGITGSPKTITRISPARFAAMPTSWCIVAWRNSISRGAPARTWVRLRPPRNIFPLPNASPPKRRSIR